MRIPALPLALTLAAVALAALPTGHPSAAAEAPTVYYTIGVLEPDRLASAWLISRHVDPQARVELLPEGAEPPEGGVPFDLPDAAWSRRATQTTFETILSAEGLDDPALRRIAGWVRAGEISYWMLEPGSAEERFDLTMKDFSRRRDVEAAYRYLDRLGGDPKAEP